MTATAIRFTVKHLSDTFTVIRARGEIVGCVAQHAQRPGAWVARDGLNYMILTGDLADGYFSTKDAAINAVKGAVV